MARIDRYLLRELFPSFLLNILFFTFVFLISQILDIMDMVVNYRVGVSTAGRLVLYLIPYFLQFTIPLSVMLTVLVTLFRLSADLEIIALKAGGYSLGRLFRPVVAFCLVGVLLSGAMTFWGLPWGKKSFRLLVEEIASEHIAVAIRPRVFNDDFNGVTLYVSEVDRKNSEIRDVFIRDNRKEGGVGTILAPTGRFVIDEANMQYRLRLEGGAIHRTDPGTGNVLVTGFSTYEVRLDFGKKAAARQKVSRHEMTYSDLKRHIASFKTPTRSYHRALLNLHEKFALPFACLALGLLAFPLGIRPLARRQASGVRTGLVYFLLYYMLLSMGSSLGESGVYPPVLAAWTPNLVVGGLGLWLFGRASKELPVHGNPFKGLMMRRGRGGA